MIDLQQGRQRLVFGPYELDRKAAELRKLGIRIKLPRQATDVLALLLERSGDVVTREELRKALWPKDTFVDFDHSLNVAVNRIRAVVEESEVKIDTIPRVGYRLVSRVGAVAPSTSPDDPATTAPASSSGRRPPRGFRLFAALLGCAAILISGAVWIFLSGHASDPIRSLAVLPMANLSNSPDQDYFADGMTEALTTDLAKIATLRVISATSAMQYKGVRKSLPAIGRELRVSAVIEGAVMRSGDRVRITVQLVDAARDEHLWSDTYERDIRDVLSLQRDLAQTIAGEIRMRLSHLDKARRARPQTIDPQAYDAYLRARHFINRRRPAEFLKAREYLQRAVGMAPDYALAWTALAECDLLIIKNADERTRTVTAAARRALELDSSLGEPHLMLAMAHTYDYQWESAEQEFRKALELSPNSPNAHDSYAMFLATRSRFDESGREAAKALELDPFSPLVHLHVGISSFLSRRYDEAIVQFERALEIDPESPWTHGFLAEVYRAQNRTGKALSEWRLSGDLPPSSDAGWAAAWKAEHGRRKAMSAAGDAVSAFHMALICVYLGRNSEAIDWLERAADAHEGNMWSLGVRPTLDPLRSEPRFIRLANRLAFPMDKPVP